MISIHFIDGLSCPFFTCDVCRQRIFDVRMAMAAWGEADERTRTVAWLRPVHVHKGRCLDSFERTLARGRLMTDELSDHLEFLSTNTRRMSSTAPKGDAT